MQTRPDKLDLLRGVESFLSDTAIPKLLDRDQFLARVAVNAIRMVIRESEAEERNLFEEREALNTLLERNKPAIEPLSGVRDAVHQMNLEISDLIRKGEFDDAPKRAELLDALKRSTLRKLEISDPKLAERIREERKAGSGKSFEEPLRS